MLRKTIIGLLGLALLAGSFLTARKMMAGKQVQKQEEPHSVTTVFSETVVNGTLPITLTSNGTLLAKNRVELFSEVQGIFEKSDGTFKPGVKFSQGSVLLRMNSDELEANLRAQKSILKNQIVLLLPDLRLDYADSFEKWESYIRNFDQQIHLQPLPKPGSEQEELFLTGRNIFTAWYNVKNLEERLAKYTITAPFSGILTEALVNPGALIRTGQKLGVFIDPGIFELEVAINVSDADLLKMGSEVILHNIERTNRWMGKVVRINGAVDQATQTIQVFIQTSGTGLKEGMYLEADLQAREEAQAYEINRKLLFDENKVFVIRDSTLQIAMIEPVYFKQNSVIVKGLKDGEKVLSQPLPGAFSGMRVMEYQDNQ